jgi:hypothetical protein
MPLSTSHASFSLPLRSNWLIIADNELVQDLRKQDPSSVCEAGDVASCQVKQLSAKLVKKGGRGGTGLILVCNCHSL